MLILRQRLFVLFLFTISFWGFAAGATTTLYVSPSGSDSNSGSESFPFRTIQKAYSLATAGTTIYLRGGLYSFSGSQQVVLSKSGSSQQPIQILNYPGELPVFDGKQMTSVWEPGFVIRLTGKHHVLRGFEVRNGSDGGIRVDGYASHNLVENMDIHHNGHKGQWGIGLMLGGNAANNEFRNIDIHHNVSVSAPGNSDGFQSNSQGQGNKLYGIRSYSNGDDGFDFWNAAPHQISNCWAWSNGYNGAGQRVGDGNGFKLGGHNNGYSSGGSTVRNSIAWNNPGNGFDENGAGIALKLYNNTAYANGGHNFAFWNLQNDFRNNASYSGKLATSGSNQANSWNLNQALSAQDFVSLSDLVVRGPRGQGYELPYSDFLRPSSSSLLIDQGVDVGSSYAGLAPDIGAFEYTESTTPPEEPLATGNLIKNSGFEEGSQDWSLWSNAEVVASGAHQGSAAIRVGTGQGGFGQELVGQVEAEQTYKLSAFARIANSEDNAWLLIEAKDASGNKLLEKSSFISSSNYSQYEIEFSVPLQATSVMVFVWKDAGTSYVYFDEFDLQLTTPLEETPPKIPEPEAPVDSSGPEVTITSLVDGQRVSRRSRIEISAVASDVSGVQSISIVVDGQEICSQNESEISCRWRAPRRASQSPIEVYATGTDVHGNEAQSEILSIYVQ